MAKFDKIERVVWILASDNGNVLAHGHQDPHMPPYHLDVVIDRLPAIVSAPNKATLGEARRAWNACMREIGGSRRTMGPYLVRERRVRITIEGEPSGKGKETRR